MRKFSFLSLLLCALIISCGGGSSNPAPPPPPPATTTYIAYVGTYTSGSSQGIYAYRFDPATGSASPLGLAAQTDNPSFLAADSQGTKLFAVNEEYGASGGTVSAFSINQKSGSLTFVNKVASQGAGPAYISLDRTSRYALVANYGGGNVASLPINTDGSLSDAVSVQQDTGSGPVAGRQDGPHAHSIEPSSDNRFVVSADLGIDKVMIYGFDASTGKLTPNTPAFAPVAPGAGPRHVAFSPDAKFLYVANELNSTVTAFAWDATQGKVTEVQTVSTLPSGWSGANSAAEIRVHPAGKFLYVSNRGRDSIAIFSINSATGALSYVEDVSSAGKTPRFFAFDPTGKWLWAANQDSANIVIFSVDSATGHLTSVGTPIALDSPVAVVFVLAQ